MEAESNHSLVKSALKASTRFAGAPLVENDNEKRPESQPLLSPTRAARQQIGVSFVEPEITPKRNKSLLFQNEPEQDDEYIGNKSMFSVKTLKEQAWKRATRTSYETMVLTKSEFNSKVRGAGFRSNGKARHIKKTCLLSKIYQRCHDIRQRPPALAVCITMYNEHVAELKTTLRGLIHNYNCFRADKDYNIQKDDFLIFIVCDGYDNIAECFKKLATEKGFLDESILEAKGFATRDERTGKLKMRPLRDVMDKSVADKDVPNNLLHVWQVTTWDVGLNEDNLKGRRVHICFGVKHRNDGKINSHRWFFQGICKYLKPELCLMLDIGTRADEYALLKLYKHMKADPLCGGCCGEIEVDLNATNEGACSCAGQGESSTSIGQYLVQCSQFYEYKMGHTPDKACESFFGFTQVLPGAYSVFRWNAIKGGPLDAFFRNVTRTETPTCAEANEYLAEDRIMCLEIYTKIGCGFKLAYVPDAKAFTDAPPEMMILMKQRRRWMNGAFFGTKKVLANCVNMISCRRTKHGGCRKCGLFAFMIYLTLTYTLQFFIVGALFAATYAFFDQVFATVFDGNWALKEAYQNGIFNMIFAYIYIFLIVMTLILALALPLERAKAWFNIVAIAFGFLTACSVFGMVYYLSYTGFYPHLKIYNTNTKDWDPQPETNFSILVLAGVIMLSVYVIPMILRPIDFLSNLSGYCIGLLTYLLLIPMYINTFSIYAFSNLHDVSWGNRPTTTGTGTEAFSNNKATQQLTEHNYQEFRANVLFIWLISNGAYFYIVLGLAGSNDPTVINNGSVGPLQVFTMILAGMVIFKVFFATIYVIKWKFRYCCNKKYKISRFSLEKTWQKRVKKEEDDGFSSDDEDIYQKAKRIYLQHEADLMTMPGGAFHELNNEPEKLELAIDHVHGKNLKKKTMKDEDYERDDLEDADEEEFEDRIVEESRRLSRPLREEEITRISNKSGLPMNSMRLSRTSSALSAVDHSQYRQRETSMVRRVSFDAKDTNLFTNARAAKNTSTHSSQASRSNGYSSQHSPKYSERRQVKPILKKSNMNDDSLASMTEHLWAQSQRQQQQQKGYQMSNNFAHDLDNLQPRQKDMTFGNKPVPGDATDSTSDFKTRSSQASEIDSVYQQKSNSSKRLLPVVVEEEEGFFATADGDAKQKQARNQLQSKQLSHMRGQSTHSFLSMAARAAGEEV